MRPTLRSALAATALAAAYLAATALGHDAVSRAYGAVFALFGRAAMEQGLHAASLLAALALAATGVSLWRRRGHALPPAPAYALAWLVAALLLAAADALLISTNVERVHYPQYALLALLLRWAWRDDLFVLVCCTLGGVLDELLQYVLMPHYTRYLDFNDFVLNLLGAALGLLLFPLLFGERGRPVPAAARRGLLGGAAAVLLLAAAAWAGGLLVAFAPPRGDACPVFAMVDGLPRMTLSFVRPEGFWSRTGFGRAYHILTPVQGLLVLGGLLHLWRAVFARLRGPDRALSPGPVPGRR
jgi:VanZ family protein